MIKKMMPCYTIYFSKVVIIALFHHRVTIQADKRRNETIGGARLSPIIDFSSLKNFETLSNFFHGEKEMMETKLTQNLHNDALLHDHFFNDD